MSTPSNPLAQHTLAELRQRRSIKWRGYPDDVLPLWVAEMDTSPAEPIREALAGALARGDLGYSTRAGVPEAFAAFAEKRYGWAVDPGQVWLTPNVMLGVAEVLRHVTEPGDGVVINPPVYPPFFHYIPDSGRRIVESPLTCVDGCWQIDIERLERDFAAGAKAYLLCNPQNPTGVAYSRETLMAIAELADRYNIRVLVDEIHAPLTYAETRHIPFRSLDVPAARRAVVFHSASKAWNLAGLTAALIVGEDLPIAENFTDAVGHLGVFATEAAFLHGLPWLESLVDGLDANRKLLAELLPETIGYTMPSATYLAWLDCSRLGLADPAAVFLERGRVAFSGGAAFGSGSHVRLNLATSPEILTEGVRRLRNALTAG
ncbi:MalY/PatB family protein [Longispora albida]|uniref:MalY/PatB family protein n=1 Tax=Longispora albida TaxID=203523 RepID=UPI000362367B|nr:aminotransferase class I/II-fold pyridoxal phosphate-dependent enzyme [Longispora albida]